MCVAFFVSQKATSVDPLFLGFLACFFLTLSASLKKKKISRLSQAYPRQKTPCTHASFPERQCNKNPSFGIYSCVNKPWLSSNSTI